MFDPVDPKQRLPALEEGILRYWQEEDVFRRSVKQRKGEGDGQSTFSFYDGPPFATGLPHYGHLLAGTIKDVIPRYQTMRGKSVERRFGWDCHGLPVENIIEKENNITSHKQIDEMGVGAFNTLCCGAVQRYTKEWRTVVERMGRWVDMDWDYRTMDPDYMESIWWVFSELFRKGLVYEGRKAMHICPRCVTPLSNFEVTQGYKDITDTSVTVKFELDEAVSDKRSAVSNQQKTYLLAWTTTPWTLPGNLLLAVDPKMKYVKLKTEAGETVIFAKAVYEKSKEKHAGQEILGELTGKQLIGKRYTPLFPYFGKMKEYKDAFRVVGADFVTADEGTGIVHIAPGFGEDDFNLGKKEKLPVLQHVTMEGKFVPEVTDFAGTEVKPIDDPGKTDRKVAEWLEKHGRLFAKESVTHSYPHCWRCDSPLLNYATSSWFVSVEKIKNDLLAANAETEWVPSHIRDGRFGKWLEGARDWAISRNRYWGTPLPIWRTQGQEGNKATGQEVEVISSRDDLMAHCKIRFTKITALRHGESEGNLIPIYQGKTPGTDLTDNGRAQAAEAAAFLKGQSIEAIYCSPLARTRQTAEVIAKKTGAPLITDERLMEVSFGDYEGKTVDFSDLTFIKARRAHKMETGTPESIYHFPGMETWSGVQKRVQSFFDDVLPKHRGGHIVVVTHADPLVNMRHFFTGEAPLKLSHQPYPVYAEPHTFFWDHGTQTQLDLHKHVVDGITWAGSKSKTDVELTLVRHGQVDLNKTDMVNGGNIDSVLNETGRGQVQALAKKLKKRKFDVIVSSDLKRAVETADILSKELKTPHVARWKELRERDTGEWTGKPVKDFVTTLPNGTTASPALHPGTPPGGESLETFLKRLDTALLRVRTEYPGKRVLLVCHSGPVRGIQALIENLSFAEAAAIDPKNADATDVRLSAPLQRIPEVLDCWFESGSMPYAQYHYPFRFGSKKLPQGFPADFIAEGIDQTRGWFYTLTVLSAALFNKPSFFHCIVNGTVLTEDGKKMSKRLKNYPEPLEVVEKYGADAIRFMLMSSPAVRGEDMRFSEKGVEEVLRSVLLPLWNAYAFFVTYANAGTWTPQETRMHSTHPLDQWIRAEVQDLSNRMTEQLERYDLSATCAELADSIDGLTNWYVRLSRRRFAGKGSLHDTDAPNAGQEEDRAAAFATLYNVLLTLGQLLAPFCPFLADALYLNLAGEKHGSVHLTDWPATRELTEEERTLLRRTRLLRTVVSLGLKLRAEATVKLRQPLAKATIAIPATLLGEPLTDEEGRLLREELNVKHIALLEDPGALGTPVALVDARKVGPRLGALVQEVIAAGKRGEFTQGKDGSVLIGEERLAPDEVRIVYVGKEGQNVAGDHGVVMSLETAMTAELVTEGCGRDLIRAIQRERKEAGLSMTEKIKLKVEGAEDVLAACGAMIAEETNAVLAEVKGEEHEAVLNGKKVTFRFERI